MVRYNWPNTMGPPGLFGLGQGHSPLLQTEVSDSVVMAAVATMHPPCGEERAGSSSGSKRDIRLGSRGLRSFTLPRGGCRWLMASQKLAPCPGTQPEEWWATGLGHPAKGIYPPTQADGGVTSLDTGLGVGRGPREIFLAIQLIREALVKEGKWVEEIQKPTIQNTGDGT